MNLIWWKEKRLRTAWRVEKGEYPSFLVGTSHFSPYRFERTLLKLIQGVETVPFEGPLDEESMARVVQYGQKGENTPSLYKALHPEVIVEINKLLSARSILQTTAVPYLDLIHPTTSDFLEIHTRGVRPWMTFFTIWSAFLNWKHSMDVEAFHLPQKLKKKIEYLETIEDQLTALDGTPFEGVSHY